MNSFKKNKNLKNKIILFCLILINCLLFLFPSFIKADHVKNDHISKILTNNNEPEGDQKNTEIPVVFATDNNYVYPTIVAINSMVLNKNEDTICDVHVLTDETVTEENKEKLMSLKQEKVNIKIVDMGNLYDGFYTGVIKSKVVYYRLKLASALSDINKCIFLDSDVLVLKDLSEMFNIDIKDYYVAGVAENSKKIDMFKESKYIYLGGNIFNLDKIREEKIEEKFDKLIEENNLKKNYRLADQDIINKICHKKMLNIPMKYNVMAAFTKYANKETKIPRCYSSEEWHEGITRPVILHFINDKPWCGFKVPCQRAWFRYAEKTKFFDEIFKFCLEKTKERFNKIINNRDKLAPKDVDFGNCGYIEPKDDAA
ncbi:MAG: glycosyltransferase family 8 protein [Oscillospiraceae bacterium]|jgi:lipopolysaccharide biosynthesis glycosyltransferase|nr:glycosyltransferase family 8 protein [Oscillospiraceae bacterium]